MPHIHEKIDFTTGVYIVHDNAVLLRKHEKYNAWLHPGGHIELDEDPIEGTVREAKEETGLDIEIIGSIPPEEATEGPHFRHILSPRFMNRHRIASGADHEHIDFIYFARSSHRHVAPAEGEVECEIRWFTRAELDDPRYELFPSVRFYALTALTELGT